MTIGNSYGEEVFTGLTAIVTPDYDADHINDGGDQHIAGQRRYELTNHLGNVLAVVTDRKQGQRTTTYQLATGGDYVFNAQANEYIYVGGTGTHDIEVSPVTEDGIFDVYLPEVMSYNDYYPFLMQIPGRSGNTDDYRYAGQGQEKLDELHEGTLSFEYRISDARIGRFLSVDPLRGTYPWNSTYAFSENRVIDCIELEGLESVSYLETDDRTTRVVEIKPLTAKQLKVALDEELAALRAKSEIEQANRESQANLESAKHLVTLNLVGNLIEEYERENLILETTLDVATDLIPVVGQIKAAGILVFDVNFVTGKEPDYADKGFSLGSLFFRQLRPLVRRRKHMAY